MSANRPAPVRVAPGPNTLRSRTPARRWSRSRVTGLATLVAATGCEAPAPPDTSLGVAHELAVLRAATLGNVAYDVRLRVPAQRDLPLTGTTAVAFDWNDPAGRDVVLDFKDPGSRVRAVRVNGESVEWEGIEDHVVVPAAALGRGARNVVELDYAAGDEALNRSDDFLYTLFVPDRAHFSLPVFDQPDLKARWTLELTVPEAWTAVANGPEVDTASSVGAPGARSDDGGAAGAERGTTYRFLETEPLPTYLFAFAAGEFRVEEAERDGRRLRMYHRETDDERVAENRDVVFDLVARSLAWMEEYTGIPFPFAKYDLVLIPPFQYGGMEHPGAVFYRQSSLLLERSATQGQILGRASLIAHETAHQWFGDLVTMRWFDDVWTKEVFANFMAAKMVHPLFPDIDHDLRFLLAHHPSAYAVDRTPGANPIRQPLDNLRHAGTLYGPIIYQKAPIVMRHLERTVGEDAFREGMREYLTRFSYGNATWPDLIGILDERTPSDLAAWSRVWVEEPGRPVIEIELEREGGRVERLALRQTDAWARGRVWPQTLELVAARGDSLERDTVTLGEAPVELERWRGRPAPDWVLPTGAGIEYGLFVLDDASLEALVAGLPGLDPPLVRGAGWLVARDAMLEGRVPPSRMLDLALEGLERETEEQLAQLLLGLVGDIFWRLLPDDVRAARAEEVERALWRGIERARAPTLKAAYLGGWRNVAVTPGALERMRRLWDGSESVPGLPPLSETELTAFASELALRGVPDAEHVLDLQLENIDNPDRRDRFEFVRPSLSADPAERAAFFASLADPARREREPWVLSGVSNLSHPLRREHGRRFVVPALDLLDEIQRTGDIFFPGRWLDAALESHNDPEVVTDVVGFLDARPDYPPRLRAKILQSVDGVSRAARILHGDQVVPALPVPAPAARVPDGRP
jgi:aminopeptidase N